MVKYNLRVFKNSGLKGIFGFKRVEMTEDRRKFRNVLHNFSLYNTISVIKSRTLRWAEHVARKEMRLMHTRLTLKWILHKYKIDDVDWIHLAQDRNLWWTVMNIVMNQ